MGLNQRVKYKVHVRNLNCRAKIFARLHKRLFNKSRIIFLVNSRPIYAVQQDTQKSVFNEWVYSALMLARHVSDLYRPIIRSVLFTNCIRRLVCGSTVRTTLHVQPLQSCMKNSSYFSDPIFYLHFPQLVRPYSFLYEGWNFNFGNTPLDWIQELPEWRANAAERMGPSPTYIHNGSGPSRNGHTQ